MTAADIAATIADYAAAAERARRAGFDGVEIAANGTYLTAQFLNPRLNYPMWPGTGRLTPASGG